MPCIRLEIVGNQMRPAWTIEPPACPSWRAVGSRSGGMQSSRSEGDEQLPTGGSGGATCFVVSAFLSAGFHKLSTSVSAAAFATWLHTTCSICRNNGRVGTMGVSPSTHAAGLGRWTPAYPGLVLRVLEVIPGGEGAEQHKSRHDRHRGKLGRQ
jgi:hypothetical protein